MFCRDFPKSKYHIHILGAAQIPSNSHSHRVDVVEIQYSLWPHCFPIFVEFAGVYVKKLWLTMMDTDFSMHYITVALYIIINDMIKCINYIYHLYLFVFNIFHFRYLTCIPKKNIRLYKMWLSASKQGSGEHQSP